VQPTSPPEEEVVEISYLEHFSTEFGDEWFDKTIANFESQHPNIKVNRISKPWNELWPSLTAWAQSEEMPDVFATHGSWLATLSEWNALYDLQEVIEENADDEYIENTGVMGPYYYGTYKGKVNGATWGYFVYGFFYNVEFFQENNLELPGTWDEFEELLRYLREEKDMYGISLVWSSPEGYSHFPYLQWGWRAANAGGKMYDEESKPAFNSPEGKLAMEYWKRLYDDDLISPNAEAMTVQQARGDFCSGKVPFIIDGPWIKGTCESLGGEFTVAMMPPICGEENCGSVVTFQYLSVGANSEHPEAAFEFIKYMQSDEVTIDWGKTYGMSTANMAYYELPETKADPVLGMIPEIAAVKENMMIPAITNKDAIDTMILEEWQAVLLEGKSIEDAIADMVAQWLELMTEF